MALSKADECYKKGLFGMTINDVSGKIDNVKDVTDWLDCMYNLAKNTTEGKSEEKGMRNLMNKVKNKNVLKLTYNKQDLEKRFDNIEVLMTTLNYIDEGSRKAWVGRTKQKGFQNTLKKCQKVAQEALNKVSEKLKQQVPTNNKNVKEIITNVIEIKKNVVEKSSDIKKSEDQVNKEVLKSIESQNLEINNEAKEEIMEEIKKIYTVDNATINKIEIVLDKKMEENTEPKQKLTIPTDVSQNVKKIVNNVIEIKKDVVNKGSDVNKIEKQVSEEIVESIKNQNININNEEKKDVINIIEESKSFSKENIKKIEIALNDKVKEKVEQKKALTIPDAKNLPPFTWLVKLWNNIDKIKKENKNNDFDEASKGIIENLPNICQEIFTKPTNDNVDLTKVPNDNVYYAKDLCALLGALKKLRDQIKSGLNKEFDNNLDNCIKKINEQIDTTWEQMKHKIGARTEGEPKKIGPLKIIKEIQTKISSWGDEYVNKLLSREENMNRFCVKHEKTDYSPYTNGAQVFWSPENPSVTDQNWTKPTKIRLSYK